MKNLNTLALLLLFAITILPSCKKDKDLQEFEENIDTGWIGEWAVSDGTANVYQNGELLADVHISTFGTIEFKNDFSGQADFGIKIGEDVEELQGPFTWEEEAFELVISYPDGIVERWAVIDDEAKMKRIQFTQKDEASNSEIELSLVLIKN